MRLRKSTSLLTRRGGVCCAVCQHLLRLMCCLQPAGADSGLRCLLPASLSSAWCTAWHGECADRAVCAGSALFFEVRHYKAQEKKFSTLGWSFLPVEVLVDPSSSPAGFGATSRYVETLA